MSDCVPDARRGLAYTPLSKVPRTRFAPGLVKPLATLSADTEATVERTMALRAVSYNAQRGGAGRLRAIAGALRHEEPDDVQPNVTPISVVMVLAPVDKGA